MRAVDPLRVSCSRSTRLLLTSIGLLLAATCCGDDLSPLPQLILEHVTPPSAPRRAIVSLEGQGFGIEGPEDAVWLSGARVRVTRWTPEQIEVEVPDRAPLGQLIFTLSAQGKRSAGVYFEVLP